MSPDEITLRDLVDASLRAVDASVYALREQLIAGQQASTREHAEVRADLGQLRSDVGDLRTRLAQAPTADEFRDHRRLVYAKIDTVAERVDALERSRDEQAGGSRMRARIWVTVVGASSVMGVVAGLVITLIRSFVPAA